MNLIEIEEPKQHKFEQKPKVQAIGIDLGTTNSLVAIIEHNEENYEILTDENGLKIIPSLVEISGVEVKSIKRLIGKSKEDLKDIHNNFAFDKIISENGEMLEFEIGGLKHNAITISAEILKKLKRIAEQKLGYEINKAVITVPAYFDEASRKATKDAAKIAGLEVLRLINEPTAAALAYGLDNGAEGHYLVYDLGGGTFDSSLLKMQKGIFKVIATMGNNNLGGDDFDYEIADYLKIEKNPQNIAKIKLAKEKFLNQEEALINGKKFSISEFNKIINGKISETIEIVKQLLDENKISANDLNGIIMVGGSSRIQLISEKLKEDLEISQDKILTNLNPDEIVAAGAAITAGSLTGVRLKNQNNLLIDITPLSIGIELMGGVVSQIIPRGSTIPMSVTQEYTTHADGQTGMQFHLLQGEREMAKDCRSLSRFELQGIPPMRAGMAKISVNFQIDADGLLTVSAIETMSGKKQTTIVKPTYGLDETKIRKMFEESMINAKSDVNARKIAEKEVEVDSLINAVKKILLDSPEILSDLERQELDLCILDLQKAVKEKHIDEIENKLSSFNKLAEPLAAKNLDKQIANSLRGEKFDKVAKNYLEK